jgi:hypothetical protein
MSQIFITRPDDEICQTADPLPAKLQSLRTESLVSADGNSFIPMGL